MRILRKIIHSRLFIIWGITLVVLVVAIAATLVLIATSKQTEIIDAPPKLPNITNPTDQLIQTERVNLFLFDPDSLETKAFKVELRLSRDMISRLKSIITALINATPTNFRNPIPRGTTLNGVYIDSQKTAYIDFTHHLVSGHIGGTTAEYITVSAILNTVFDAFPDEIKYIQILIDGQEVEEISGHINLSQPIRY